MSNFWDWLTYHKMGKPAAGMIASHPLNTFAFEEGAELIQRLTGTFGDLSKLVCLDLGCGPSDTAVASQVLEIPWRRLVSVEGFMPYVYRLREKTAKAQRHDIHEIRIETIFNELMTREADVALLIDVIEHFPRRQALSLLARLESFVSRGVVIFSPLGQVPQDDLDNNNLQRHRSFWQAEDFSRLGYQVEVYEGFHGQLSPPPSAAWAIKTWKR